MIARAARRGAGRERAMANSGESGGSGAAPVHGAVVGECDVRLWGLSSAERYARAFERAGLQPVTGLPEPGAAAVLVRADWVLAESLVKALAVRPGAALVTPPAAGRAAELVAAHCPPGHAPALAGLLAGGAGAADLPAGLEPMDPRQLGSSYNAALRKLADPLALSLRETPAAEVERRMFADVYKGATDFVTKWCWPVPARWVTRWAAARGITPNTVTTASLVLVILACLLFAAGNFLLGIPVAWAMTFLDTVDGKLARLTLTSSYWGNLYDHGIDLLHPPFWWWAWYHGVGMRAGGEPGELVTLAFWIVMAGYVLGRVLEGIFLHGFKIQTHVWRPVDYYFRTITARRNPNLAILMVFACLGRPGEGLVAVAVWTLVSLAFHSVRLLQAAALRLRGGSVRSWMTEEEPGR